jgi:hemerythrin-like domain-containing protein
MLISVRGPTQQTPEGTPSLVDALLDCHARIRHFAALAVKLASVDAGPAEIADVAAKVHRYFTVAMPLHVADEDRTLFSRMLPVASIRVREALLTMTQQHVAIAALLFELTEEWTRLIADPTARDALNPRLIEASTRLEDLLREHLSLEEEVILPEIPHLLSEQEQLDALAEIRARRR